MCWGKKNTILSPFTLLKNRSTTYLYIDRCYIFIKSRQKRNAVLYLFLFCCTFHLNIEQMDLMKCRLPKYGYCKSTSNNNNNNELWMDIWDENRTTLKGCNRVCICSYCIRPGWFCFQGLALKSMTRTTHFYMLLTRHLWKRRHFETCPWVTAI